MHQLPLARIKKVMKADSEVKMISAEAPILFAKGCDVFITELTMRAWIHAEENKRRTLQRSDIAAALAKSDMYDFLIDIVPREEAGPSNQRRPTHPPAAGQQQQPPPAMPAPQVQQQMHAPPHHEQQAYNYPGHMPAEQEYRQPPMYAPPEQAYAHPPPMFDQGMYGGYHMQPQQVCIPSAIVLVPHH
jgi:nuclear transcription factor Y gamma